MRGLSAPTATLFACLFLWVASARADVAPWPPEEEPPPPPSAAYEQGYALGRMIGFACVGGGCCAVFAGGLVAAGVALWRAQQKKKAG